MARNMLNRNFQEFIALLNARGVKYLVVGGYAVGFHGHPRYTKDLDVFIAVSDANAGKLVEVFKEFGFSENPPDKDSFLTPQNIVEIGREPQMIHVCTDIDGVTFNECYRGRILMKDGNLTIPFIGLEELLKNKQSTRRSKDRIDVIELKKVMRKSQRTPRKAG
jgi:predicted nucleotidyltransferase